MTPRAFCQHGAAEGLKGAVHGMMLAGASACCGYNLAAFYYRRQRHNVINALVYAGLVWLEWEHVRHHAEH